MLEQLLVENKPAGWVIPDAPGPATLAAGNDTDGYFGTMTAAEMFTSSELATACGIGSQGVMLNDSTRWIKAVIDRKIVYYPMLPLRYGLSYNALNDAKLLTKAQNTRVTKFGRQFIVRAFIADGPGPAQMDVPAGTGASEFNRLIYRVCADTPPGVSVTKFANFTLAELGMPLAAGCCYICIGRATNSYIQRNGGGGTDASTGWYTMQTPSASLADQYRGWRPLLELVP